jgi:hypothetical protein
MALDPVQVPRHAIEPARERGLQPVGAVGRQMRSERRLDHQRLRHALTRGIVGELPSEIRREAKCVLWSAWLHLHVIAGIEQDLAGDGSKSALHDALALRWRDLRSRIPLAQRQRRPNRCSAEPEEVRRPVAISDR